MKNMDKLILAVAAWLQERGLLYFAVMLLALMVTIIVLGALIGLCNIISGGDTFLR